MFLFFVLTLSLSFHHLIISEINSILNIYIYVLIIISRQFNNNSTNNSVSVPIITHPFLSYYLIISGIASILIVTRKTIQGQHQDNSASVLALTLSLYQALSFYSTIITTQSRDKIVTVFLFSLTHSFHKTSEPSQSCFLMGTFLITTRPCCNSHLL